MKKTLTGVAVLLIASAVANAEIIGLVDSAVTNGAGVSSLTIPGFNLGAGNALVVMISGEGPDSSPTYSVTFGGSDVTNNVFEKEGNQGSGVFYAINPSTTSGDVVISFDGSTAGAVTALSLSDVGGLYSSATFGEADNSDDSWTLNYTGTAGGFVVGTMVDNAWSGENSGPDISGDNIDTYTLQLGWDAMGGSAGFAQAYGDIASAGSFSETFAWETGSSSSRNSGALAAFAAIPEPGTISLISVLGAGILFIRRRFMM